MVQGGARMRGGPAPDPTALRRSRDGKEWTKLPLAGRGDVPAPPWPLEEDPAETAALEWLEGHCIELRESWAAAADGRVARGLARQLADAERNLAMDRARVAARTRSENELWERLWRLPQALVWEADQGHLQVAMYVRAFLEASRPEATAGSRTLARQYADALLLTTPALHAMRYVIDAPLPGAVAADLVGEIAAQPRTASSPGRGRFRVVPPTAPTTDDKDPA